MKHKEKIAMFWSKMLILKGRAMMYYSFVSLLMILKIFLSTFENQSLGIGLFIAGMLSIGIITILDYKYIYGRESEIMWTKNRTTNEMAKRIARLEEKIDKITNKIGVDREYRCF